MPNDGKIRVFATIVWSISPSKVSVGLAKTANPSVEFENSSGKPTVHLPTPSFPSGKPGFDLPTLVNSWGK